MNVALRQASVEQVQGLIHTLLIQDVGDLNYGVEDFINYQILHPEECELASCEVNEIIQSFGCRWSLEYSGTPVNIPGKYFIRAWNEKRNDWSNEYEIDSGLVIV